MIMIVPPKGIYTPNYLMIITGNSLIQPTGFFVTSGLVMLNAWMGHTKFKSPLGFGILLTAEIKGPIYGISIKTILAII